MLNQAGAAFIIENDGNGNWNTKQKLVASDRRANDVFGLFVAIDGNYAAVGAYGHDFDANGANNLEAAGAVYVFKRNSSGQWLEVQKVVASDRSIGDKFGSGVTMSGDYLFVSSTKNSTDSIGGNFVSEAGACYVFKKDGSGVWKQHQKLIASDRKANDEFGSSIDASGKYLVLGTTKHSYDASGSNYMINSGAAYVFEMNGSGMWKEVKKLVASDRKADANFGSVSIDSNIIAVGAPNETTDGNGSNSLTGAGAAYFYERDGSGNWKETDKVVHNDRKTGDKLAINVTVSGKYAVAGAQFNDYDQDGASYSEDAGAAYIFERNSNGTWSEIQKIAASDRTAGDAFGRLAFNGTSIIIGARWQDTDSKGSNFISSAGACYIFDLKSTGIKKDPANDIACYPNPTNGEILIDLSNNLRCRNYAIYNAAGQQIKSGGNFDSNIIRITIPEPDGFYLIKIETEDGGMISKTILKTR